MLINTNHAFKEWAIAIKALESGKTIMLLRKGGIREVDHTFRVQHQRFWLYPTYEHQKSELLKPEYASQVTPVPSGWHPEQIIINSAAEITDIWQISNPEIVASLDPHHIWNEQFIRQRLQWKPRQPLTALLLRTYLLNHPRTINYNMKYSGCKSWLDLEESITSANLIPVFNEQEYQQKTREIFHKNHNSRLIIPREQAIDNR